MMLVIERCLVVSRYLPPDCWYIKILPQNACFLPDFQGYLEEMADV